MKTDHPVTLSDVLSVFTNMLPPKSDLLGTQRRKRTLDPKIPMEVKSLPTNLSAPSAIPPQARKLSDDDEYPICPNCHGEQRGEDDMCMLCADKGYVRENECPSIMLQVWRDFEPIQVVATLYSNGDVREAYVAEAGGGYESGHQIELTLEEMAEAKRAWKESL